MKGLARFVSREPVRVWGYGVLVPACGVLFVYGLLTAEQAAAWIALGAGVVGVPVGAEVVRGKVTPVSKLGDVDRLPSGD